MANKKNGNNKKYNREVEGRVKENQNEKVDNGGLPEGNYIIEVFSGGKLIKKTVVTDSEIKVSKLRDGGITVELM